MRYDSVPEMVEDHILAETIERESMSEDGVHWHKEYRARRHQDTWYVEFRYLSRIDGKIYARIEGRTALFTDPDSTWRVMSQAHDLHTAIDDYIGDSDFFKAVSLDSAHLKAVNRLQAARERNRLIGEAEERSKWASARLDEFVREQTKQFNKRHGDKTGDAFDKAKARTLARTRPEFDRLKQEAKAAAAAFAKIKEEVGHETSRVI